MNILAGIIIALTIVGGCAAFYNIGKPRKPTTAGGVIFAAICATVEIWLLWSAYL